MERDHLDHAKGIGAPDDSVDQSLTILDFEKKENKPLSFLNHCHLGLCHLQPTLHSKGHRHINIILEYQKIVR